jgi:hypothetical protein
MSHKASLPRTLDLFEATPTASPSSSRRTPASAKPLELARLPDADLAKLLGEVIGELQHRLTSGRGTQPELERAVRDALSPLGRLVPAHAKSDRRQRRTEGSSLQEGQRKAVRAALLAGVAPGQVAKHFGLPLAAVRKVLEEAA